MSTQLQLRRGTTAQHSTFTGASGEITIDTDKKTVVVHNGTTAGGMPVLPKTITDGTANGVLYLNGSKQVTSGSALTFDGTNLALFTAIASNPTVKAIGSDTASYALIQTGSTIGSRVVLNFTPSGGKRWDITSSSAGSLTIVNNTDSITAATFDSSSNLTLNTGNLVIGTSGKGVITPLIYSVKGNTGSIAHNTWVTIFTADRGMFQIVARLPAGEGNTGYYMIFATVVCDGYSSRIVSNETSYVKFQLSGNNVQVAQLSGGTQSGGISYSYVKQLID